MNVDKKVFLVCTALGFIGVLSIIWHTNLSDKVIIVNCFDVNNNLIQDLTCEKTIKDVHPIIELSIMFGASLILFFVVALLFGLLYLVQR